MNFSSLYHQEHPLLGHRVVDTLNGRIGILRAICPEPADSGASRKVQPLKRTPMAWLAPIGGGREWTTAPTAIEKAPHESIFGLDSRAS
ncbi:hypothetical protein [Streptomyces odontomachi]|uniref:hypothetical protein n=1 Tax=Streptomyces odontomachi TaxID=2944940 RepID=UPI00210B51BD|nr:hypothetical protein [Streptomyces sp. ODS25]